MSASGALGSAKRVRLCRATELPTGSKPGMASFLSGSGNQQEAQQTAPEVEACAAVLLCNSCK